jgi:hypothetical protein
MGAAVELVECRSLALQDPAEPTRSGDNPHMALPERAQAAQDYALMNTHFEMAMEPGTPAQRGTHFRLADRYLREVMEATLQMMDASDGPQVAAVYDAMCATADKMQASLAEFEAANGKIDDLDHAFDLDWMKVKGGGWAYMGMDDQLQQDETERIRPSLSPIDISSERAQRRPDAQQVPGPLADRLTRLNDVTRELSELERAIAERNLAQMVDDPAASFDPSF